MRDFWRGGAAAIPAGAVKLTLAAGESRLILFE
jgi:hypothetical protein